MPKVVSSNPIHGEVYSIQHYVMQFIMWFSPGIPVSSTNKTDSHGITKIIVESGVKHNKPKPSYEEKTKAVMVTNSNNINKTKTYRLLKSLNIKKKQKTKNKTTTSHVLYLLEISWVCYGNTKLNSLIVHGYVSFVLFTILPFPHSWHITVLVKIVAQRVLLLE